MKPCNFVSFESLLCPKTPRRCVVLNHSTLSGTMFEMQHFVQHVPHVPCCCEICHILCSAVILSDDNIFPPEKKLKTLFPLPPPLPLFPPFSPPPPRPPPAPPGLAAVGFQHVLNLYFAKYNIILSIFWNDTFYEQGWVIDTRD